VINEIIRQLSIHTSIEERVLYPLTRAKIPEGNEGNKLSDHGLKEHREMKEILDRLQSMDVDCAQFGEDVSSLLHDVKHHHKDEERDIFPQLRTHLNKEELIDMGAQLDAAKNSARTHPHPNLPDQPPFNYAVEPLIHVLDTVMDSGRNFPAETHDAHNLKPGDNLDNRMPAKAQSK